MKLLVKMIKKHIKQKKEQKQNLLLENFNYNEHFKTVTAP